MEQDFVAAQQTTSANDKNDTVSLFFKNFKIGKYIIYY